MGSEDDDDGDDRKFGVSRKIMIVSISCLLGVVMLIILLHLYARYLLRRQERRRRASAALNSQGITQIAAIGESPINDEPPKSGLDPSVIASLPTLTYKLIITGLHQADDDEARECSICLGTITEESTVRVLPNCKHIFHVECIDSWLGSHTTCPICRTVADPTVQAADSNELGSIQAADSNELGSRVQPTAPPLDQNASDSTAQAGSGSRFGSFKRMLSAKESGSRVRPTAPPIDENSSHSSAQAGSRFGSFRRILGRERSSSRIQSCVDEAMGSQDLEKR